MVNEQRSQNKRHQAFQKSHRYWRPFHDQSRESVADSTEQGLYLHGHGSFRKRAGAVLMALEDRSEAKVVATGISSYHTTVRREYRSDSGYTPQIQRLTTGTAFSVVSTSTVQYIISLTSHVRTLQKIHQRQRDKFIREKGQKFGTEMTTKPLENSP